MMNSFSVGEVKVVAGMGGHPPEFFARRIVEKALHIADTTPEPLKAQAYAYRDQLYALVLDGISRAIQSDRANRKD